MGRFIRVELNEQERAALEKGYRMGKSHAFRTRCQMVLLKSEGRKSKEISQFLGCHEISVNSWVKRYKDRGIEGLKTKEGRGRPPILSEKEDSAKVREAVKRHRQRVSLAKVELEKSFRKGFSQRTLTRFLKSLVADINESAEG